METVVLDNPSNFLSSNIVGIMIGIIGIVLAIYFYMRSRKYKRIIYAIRSGNLINNVSKKFPLLDVKYDGKKIENLTVSKILIHNSGKDIVSNSDIASAAPIKIVPADSTDILEISVDVLDNDASQVRVSEAKEKNDRTSYIIEFDYLDPNDGVTFNVIHSGYGKQDDIAVEGAIKGAGRLIKKKKVKTASEDIAAYAVIASYAILGFSLLIFWSGRSSFFGYGPDDWQRQLVVFLSIVICGGVGIELGRRVGKFCDRRLASSVKAF